MLSAETVNRQYFQEAYQTGIHGWAVEEPSPYAVAFLEQLSRQTPGGRVLDVGCGEGRHTFAAVRLGFDVTAIDYEPLALRRARRFARLNGLTGIPFQHANVLSLPFPEACFDAVLDYGCLHHQRTADWPTYKASILRVLKPRGFFILSVFSPRFRLFRGSRKPWHVAHGAYRRCFTKKEITGLFGKEFCLISIAEAGGFWHVFMERCSPKGPSYSTAQKGQSPC